MQSDFKCQVYFKYIWMAFYTWNHPCNFIMIITYINRSLFIFWNIYIYHEFYVIWFLLDYMWGPRMKVMWQMYSWKGKVLVYVMRYIRLCGMCYYIIHWYYSKSVWVIHTVWLQNMPYNQRKLLLPCDFISPLLYENCMCNTFSILKEL